MTAVRASEIAARREATVSVVLPVFNRAEGLRRLLRALARQHFPMDRLEVVICDDGSTEDIASVVAGFRQEAPLRTLYLRQANAGPGAARNMGMAVAAGEFLAFTDSDCAPEPDWLARLLAAFDDPAVGIAGGAVTYRSCEFLSGRCTNYLMSSALGAAGARDPRSAIAMRYYPRTCNMAVRRALAEAAGGFPQARHGEDLEFSHRVVDLGVRARFVADAVVVHHERRSPLQVAAEAFRKGAARVRLARRHGLLELVHLVPALFCLYLAALLLAALIHLQAAAWAAIPLAVYGLMLAALGLHGAASVRSARAAPVIPLFALLMHLGYGLGYLRAWISAAAPQPPPPAEKTAAAPLGPERPHWAKRLFW